MVYHDVIEIVFEYDVVVFYIEIRCLIEIINQYIMLELRTIQQYTI